MKTLTQKPQIAATTEQMYHLADVGKTAIWKALNEFGLDKEGAQRVHARGGEFTEAIRAAVIASLKDLAVTDKFKDEEVESSYGYLSGYKNPVGLIPQIERLQKLFPGLGEANQEILAKLSMGDDWLPTTAEGFFAIPNLWKADGLPKIFGSTYSEAVLKVLEVIKKDREGKLYNYRDGEIDEKHLRQSAHSAEFLKKTSEAQGDPDILIVPAQLGIRHRGRSVRRAREVFLNNEFGLGAFAVGIMILTHPIRLQHYDDLWIDCAGDEFSPDGDGAFSEAPYFEFHGDRVEFDAKVVDLAHGLYGSASGFSPQ